MNSNPKVSVIIPTHNHAHFLPECLNSIKSQTYSDYEVIVVNNGSTDNTEEVIKSFSWDKIRYCYQQDTGSVAGPRNAGIRLAKGMYVAFLDSDDTWYKTKLEKVMAIFEANKEIDVIAHDMFLVRDKKNVYILKSGPLKKDMFYSLLKKNRLIGSATVVKKSTMLEIGGFDGDKRFVHAEDYDVWLKLAFLGKRFYFINEPLGEYRFHKTNNLTTDFENSLKNEKNVIDKHFGNFKTKIPFLKSISYRNRLCNIYFRCAVQHIFRKKFYKGTNYFIKCFILNPFCLIYNLFYLIKNKV